MPTSFSVDDFIIGKRSKYRIVDDNVPRGGQAINYYVVDSDDVQCFLKMFTEPTRRSPNADEFVKRQQLLVQRLAEISDYVCRDIEFFESGGVFFKVQERMTGDTLHDRLQKAAAHPDNPEYWPQSNRLANATVLARTLAEVHDHGVAHLDLKPENCYLAEKTLVSTKSSVSVIRLLDFDGGIVDGAPAPRQILCTPKYQSPEHAIPGYYGPPGKHSDVFAFGIMLYEMLVRQYPFKTRQDFRSRAALHPCELAPWLPPEVGDIIWQALNPTPADRPSARQIFEILVRRPFDIVPDNHHEASPAAVGPIVVWDAPDVLRTQPVAVEPVLQSEKPVESDRPEPFMDAQTVWMVLLAPNRRIRIWKDGYLSRDLLRGVFGYQDITIRQARVYRALQGWMIEPLPDTAYPLLLNGRQLAIGKKYRLSSGDTLCVGRLKVEIDFQPIDET